MDSFSLTETLSKVEDEKKQQIEEIEKRCGKNKTLNFFKLSIYKWDLNDATKFYKNDKFCWNYCIYKKCKNKNKCQYHHDDNMKLHNMIKNKSNTKEDYKYIEILIEYLLSLEKYKNNSMVYRYYAKLHYKMKNIDKSERLFLKSIEINPNNARSHNDYAILLKTEKQDFVNAKIHYQKAIDLKLIQDACYGNMANLLCNNMRNYSESLIFSTKAVSLNDKDGDWTYLVGEAYYNLKQWSLGKEYYIKTLKLGNATASYGYNKKTVEAKIDKINKMGKEESSNLWYKTISSNMCDNKIGNDPNEQNKFYQSCLDTNSEMSICLILFAMKRFNLSKDLLIDTIKQTPNNKIENLRCTITNVIKDLIDVMDETDNMESENKIADELYSWKYSIVKHLVTQVKADKCNDDERESILPIKEEVNEEMGMNGDWEEDLNKLIQVSNISNNDLDLQECSTVLKLITKQKNRLRTKFSGKVSTMSQSLFAVRVCYNYMMFALCHMIDCLIYVFRMMLQKHKLILKRNVK